MTVKNKKNKDPLLFIPNQDLINTIIIKPPTQPENNKKTNKSIQTAVYISKSKSRLNQIK